MRQVVAILGLRTVQLARMVANGGWRAMVVLSLLALLTAYGIKLLTDKNVLLLNIIVCCLLYLADTMRKDKAFLFLLKRNGDLLRLAEYSLFVLLCNIYAVALSPLNTVYVSGALLFVILLVSMQQSIASLKLPDVPRVLTAFLPLQLYDLKYGLRQLFPLFILFWILSVVLSFYGPALPFFMLIIPVLFVDHITYTEPVEITQSQQFLTNAINRKMGRLALSISLFFAPQLFISLYLWYSTIFFIAAAASFWAAFSTITYALLLRYANDTTIFSSISKSIRVLLFLATIPLPPLSVYFLYRQYKTAKCNLQPLLR